uniref:Uncharacterized protein n=1 Tax=Syphacia muris TaxID=451379 RepID=A0A0N5AJ28_9BILA
MELLSDLFVSLQKATNILRRKKFYNSGQYLLASEGEKKRLLHSNAEDSLRWEYGEEKIVFHCQITFLI